MSQSLVKNLVHLVYSTKHREPLIPKSHQQALFAYQAGIFQQWESPALVIGGIEDHVHALFALSKNHPLKKIVEEMKKGSSKWMKTDAPRVQQFSWQAGYAAFSVSQSNVETVQRYIEKQEEHHRKMSFQDELRTLFKRHALNLMNDMCGIEMRANNDLAKGHAPLRFAPMGQNKPAWGNAPGRWFRYYFQALKGRNILRSGCIALSGLVGLWDMFTRGVAPSWFVIAPSARWARGALWKAKPQPCSVRFMLVLVFGFVQTSFAANSPLANAAEKSDRATIRTLLKQHADVNAPQADGMTALHWATHHDDLETAKLLIKAKANVNATNHYGMAPLSLACQNGNGDLLELLLTAGADVNTTLRGGETVLMTAARTGKIGPVKALLTRGAKVDAKERRGQTALMWAAADGHAAVVELLLKAGADFRTPSPDSGFTPLFFAAREGQAEVVRALLKAGADVNEAMQPKRTNIKTPAKGSSALTLAIENGHFELALELVKAGADPNDQRSGFTPLHMMTWVRKPQRGEDYGAPPPLGSGNLNSAQFIRKLVKHGADVNARLKTGKGGPGKWNPVGATPFLMASETADIVYMKLLLELGADPKIANADNCTPLMVACGIGVGSAQATEVAGEEPEVLEAAKLLLSLGADVNAVDANGETAMHGAALKNLPKVVQFLADYGAKVEVWNKENKFGSTPLMLAQGYRPGNFKPSFETVEAIQRVMLAAGVTPPTEARPDDLNNSDWAPSKPKKQP